MAKLFKPGRKGTVKRVVKDLNTGLFFRNMDQWTANVAEAANFRDTLAALHFCEKSNLFGVAIVLVTQDGQRILGFRRHTHSLSANHPPLPQDQAGLQSLVQKDSALH